MSASDKREPSCIHSEPGQAQPMSKCRICVNDPRLAEWKAYWRSEEGRRRMAGETR